MISFSKLTFRYPGNATPILNGLDLQIPAGTLTLVTGPSGSGKSTLLRCLNGLVPHFSGGQISGALTVLGTDPIAAGPQSMARNVGFVFQEPEAQFVFDIVEDEIAFALENAGQPREQIKTRVTEVCHYLHLDSLRHKPVNQISGGEKQRVAIASALANQPQVLVLDEPTSQLDPQSADELLRYVVSLKQELGLTVLIAEHRLERLLPYADLMLHLRPDGRFLFGEPRKVLAEMTQVPPIITLARRLNITPLPLSIDSFPPVNPSEKNDPVPAPVAPFPPDKKEGLTIRHVSAALGEHQVLKDLSFDLGQGEILTLMGPNGAGKTTLLRALFGLIPSEGEIHLLGQRIGQGSLGEIIQHVAYLPQNPNDLLFAETVLDELRVTLHNHGQERESAQLTQFLADFGLAEKQNRYPRDLSVGERQRTALASVTVHDPAFILLDEPTRGLDYQNKADLAALLKRWRTAGKGIFVVTHDIEFAAHLADRVLIMEQGEIHFSGSPQAAFHNFPNYRTQTAQIFPQTEWITPEDVPRLSE